jgi:peptide/nickel transport system substrate-binding protein
MPPAVLGWVPEITGAGSACVSGIYDGFYVIMNDGTFRPMLAETWDIADDFTYIDFHLRHGVKFHDGSDFNADVAKWNLDLMMEAKRQPYWASTEVINEYTIRIYVTQWINTIMSTFQGMGGTWMSSKVAYDTYGIDYMRQNPVGTGPFKFESYEPRQKVVLTANPKYFRGTPILEKVTARFMPDVSSREFGLQTGELHIIEGLKEEKWIEKISTFKDVKAPTFGPCETQMLYFNMSIAPFNDLRVRKAFSYALSRDVIAQFMGKSLAVPIYSPALAPPALGALTNDEALEAGVVYDNNIEQAKQLLAEAGFPNGFKTEVIISEMSSSYQKPMVAIQALVRKAGIDMQLKVVDHASFHTKIRENASPIVYYACWRPNLDVFLTQFYHSNSVVQTGKKPITNFSHYGLMDANGDGKVDSVDTLIEKARWELDARKQEAIWKKAQIQILKDVVSVPIIRLKYTFPQKSYVDLGHPLEWSWQTYSPQITEKTRVLAHN